MNTTKYAATIKYVVSIERVYKGSTSFGDKKTFGLFKVERGLKGVNRIHRDWTGLYVLVEDTEIPTWEEDHPGVELEPVTDQSLADSLMVSYTLFGRVTDCQEHQW
jgi:hypothetical protein